MEEASENGKELLHSAHTNGMNEWTRILLYPEKTNCEVFCFVMLLIAKNMYCQWQVNEIWVQRASRIILADENRGASVLSGWRQITRTMIQPLLSFEVLHLQCCLIWPSLLFVKCRYSETIGTVFGCHSNPWQLAKSHLDLLFSEQNSALLLNLSLRKVWKSLNFFRDFTDNGKAESQTHKEQNAWNENLSKEIKLFKPALKRFLLTHLFYSVEEYLDFRHNKQWI